MPQILLCVNSTQLHCNVPFHTFHDSDQTRLCTFSQYFLLLIVMNRSFSTYQFISVSSKFTCKIGQLGRKAEFELTKFCFVSLQLNCIVMFLSTHFTSDPNMYILSLIVIVERHRWRFLNMSVYFCLIKNHL